MIDSIDLGLVPVSSFPRISTVYGRKNFSDDIDRISTAKKAVLRRHTLPVRKVQTFSRPLKPKPNERGFHATPYDMPPAVNPISPTVVDKIVLPPYIAPAAPPVQDKPKKSAAEIIAEATEAIKGATAAVQVIKSPYSPQVRPARPAGKPAIPEVGEPKAKGGGNTTAYIMGAAILAAGFIAYQNSNK